MCGLVRGKMTLARGVVLGGSCAQWAHSNFDISMAIQANATKISRSRYRSSKTIRPYYWETSPAVATATGEVWGFCLLGWKDQTVSYKICMDLVLTAATGRL
jgi:alpha-galactosidase